MNIKEANQLLKEYMSFENGIVGIQFDGGIYHLHFTNGENICFQENKIIENTLIINSLDQLHLYIREKIVCEKCLKDWLFKTDTEIKRVFKEIGITTVLN